MKQDNRRKYYDHLGSTNTKRLSTSRIVLVFKESISDMNIRITVSKYYLSFYIYKIYTYVYSLIYKRKYIRA